VALLYKRLIMIDYTQTSQRVSLPRLIIFWTFLLAALLTASSEFSLPAGIGRFVYWAAHIGLGLTAVTLVTRWLQQRGLSKLGEWTQLAVSSLVAVVVFAPVGVVLDILLPASFGPDGHGDLLENESSGSVVYEIVDEVLSAAPTVVAVWLIVHLTYRFMNRVTPPADSQVQQTSVSEAQPETTPQTSTQSDIDTVEPAGFFAKLSPAIGTDVMLIRSDANYIHVQTTAGKTMFLYSINRAAEELGDRGLLVHRSFWIASDHVGQVRKQGAQTVCVLNDGTVVPVSRRRQKNVLDLFGRDFIRAKPTN